MHKFVRSLLTEWRRLKLPFTGETFVVGVSGGADSVSLALALNELKELEKLNLRFVVAHFNHDLRGVESGEDELFVRDFAAKYDLELAFYKEKISGSGNLEQNARLARYEFLRETAENLRAFGVLTAHTLNDQAETFLLNLIRGSGLEGLGGMKSIRSLEFGVQSQKSQLRITNYELRESETEDESEIQNQNSEIKLIRPLLSWAKRETTENFCRENEVEFRYDSMNDDLAFKRVRIRKVLLPLLKDFNPKIVETLAKTANLLREDFAGLEKSADASVKNFAARKPDEQSLDLKELKNLFPSMRRQILREWLKKMRGDLRALDSNHVEAIENLIFSRKSGRVIQLPNGETVTKRQGRLFFEKTKVEKSAVENYN
ncbi:MAG: tRNA lysidine(34) synthetase TilS [Acidobacteriota bacterium]|nr:tRNA lysidine(34) synthetase TilS [Acidobacteriota bacterium]